MPSQNEVQQFVHRLEEGGWVKWIQLTALVTVCVAMYTLFIFDPFYMGLFKGLSHPKGMEQAQIGRELARHHGFSSKTIRPAVINQFKINTGSIPLDNMPDTYYAPVWPVVMAPFIWIVKSTWLMDTKEFIYPADRMIAGVAAAIFLLSALINYFTIRQLFDHQLAILTVGLVLLCDVFWKYSLSGLPQTLMAFFFSGASYALVRAVQNRIEERPTMAWLATASAIFALLALTHGLTIWIFAGAVVFCAIYFKPRRLTVLVMVGVFLALYSPWLIRNYHVCGNIGGAAWNTVFYQLRGTEGSIMRDVEFRTQGITPTIFRFKVQSSIGSQLGDLLNLLGGCVVAPLFFVALLHLFKNRAPSIIRWLFLCMWFFGVIGIAVFGFADESGQLQSNNLHILFIPMFAAYGFAFLLVMWTRLEINVSLVQKAFITLIYALSAIPIFNTLTANQKGVVQWPPYVPPYIAILHGWTTEDEIIASDMPWAVAWYADRKSLWLPITLQDFVDLNDNNTLGGRIVGLYLTPVTGNRALIADIVKGEYKDWAPFILRSVNAKDFPLRAATALPIDNQCIFYSDHDRWTDRID